MHQPRKRFGQHFLEDDNVIQRLGCHRAASWPAPGGNRPRPWRADLASIT
jgi:hypothetical protein